MRITYVHIGDTHHGLRNGLIAPGTELEYSDNKQREVLLSDWSKWIWEEVWLPGIEQVSAYAGDDPVILLHSGDACHGSRFVEHLYSPFIDHQVKIGVGAFEPWRKLNLRGIFIAFGTGAHDFGENASSKLLRNALTPWGIQVESSDQLLISDDNFLVDLSHHGPTVSDIPHVKGNMARKYAVLKAKDWLERGRQVPGWFCRGHVHKDCNEPVSFDFAGKYHRSHISVNPPLCGPNGYARQASRGLDRARCGFFYTAVDGGVMDDVHDFIRERDTGRFVPVTLNVAYNSGATEQPGYRTKKSQEYKKKKGLFRK